MIKFILNRFMFETKICQCHKTKHFSPQMLWWQSGGDKIVHVPTVNDVSALYSSLYSLSVRLLSALRPSRFSEKIAEGQMKALAASLRYQLRQIFPRTSPCCPQDVYTQLPSHPWPSFASFIHFLCFSPPDTHRQTQTASIGRSPSHAFRSTASDLLVLPQICVTSPCRPSTQNRLCQLA